MTRRIFSCDEPDRFVAGTVGDPGARTFFLQARDGGRIVTIVLEKTQVAVMAERLTALLDELARHGLEVPAAAAPDDKGPLDEPVAEAFRAGTLSLTWDGERERIIVEAREITEADEAGESLDPTDTDDDEDGPDMIRVILRPASARVFADRATH